MDVIDSRLIIPACSMNLLILGQRPQGARPSTVMVTAKSGRLVGVRSAHRIPAWEITVSKGQLVALPEGSWFVANPGDVLIAENSRAESRNEPRTFIASFYMDNIPQEALNSQRNVLSMFGHHVNQVRFEDSHQRAIDRFISGLAWGPKDRILILDVDAVPVRSDSIRRLMEVVDQGRLVGCAQTANHMRKDHTYAGPFCVGFTRETWERLGRPSFGKTSRSDVGEELTWLAAERGVPATLLLPTSIEAPRWNLACGGKFGLGTGYGLDDGAELFWHAFESRRDSDRFIRKCGKLLRGRIVGAYHVAMMNDWVPLVMEQEARLIKSGLLEATDKVIIGIVGKDDVAKWRMSGELARKAVIVRDENMGHYEHVTLGALQRESMNGDFKAWYVHTKGISGHGDPSCVRDWRRVMEHFVIDGFRECVRTLDSCDACGIKLVRNPPHFSGNFWWANAGHLRRLPEMGVGKRDRGYSESWIGMSGARLHSLHDCDVYYDKPYPESMYVGPGITMRFAQRLGNHLFQYAYSRALAEEQKVAWSLDSDLIKRTFPNVKTSAGSAREYQVPSGGPWYQEIIHHELLLRHRNNIRSWLVPSGFGADFLKSKGWPEVINVRGGDFAGMNLVIKPGFYERIIDKKSNQLVVTDDPSYARKLVPGLEVIHTKDDFSVLYHSRKLALSLSTYCWWAAFLGNQERVIAPNGWYDDDGCLRKMDWSVRNLGWQTVPCEGRMP